MIFNNTDMTSLLGVFCRACIARGVLSGEVDEAGTDAIVAALVTPSPDHTPLIRSNLTAACAALEYIKVRF